MGLRDAPGGFPVRLTVSWLSTGAHCLGGIRDEEKQLGNIPEKTPEERRGRLEHGAVEERKARIQSEVEIEEVAAYVITRLTSAFSVSLSLPFLLFSLLLRLFYYSYWIRQLSNLRWNLYSHMSSGMDSGATADHPSDAWRKLSSATMCGVGALCRSFLLGVNKPEFHGMDAFMELLDERGNSSQRTRGLLTGINPPPSGKICDEC